MADGYSRHLDLSDPWLLAYFNVTYPKKERWQMRHVHLTMISTLIYSLQCKRQLLPKIIPGPKFAENVGEVPTILYRDRST